jgi:sugar/nucleoside kinase (ribokinase family)
MTTQSAPNCLLLGRLQRDTLITAQGQAIIDQPGGNLLYAAAAYQLWGDKPGLVSRVGADFPDGWEEQLQEKGIDTQGIRKLADPQDLRRFLAYSDVLTAHRENPIKYFAKWGLPMPKPLLGHQAPSSNPDDRRARSPLSLRPEDLPDGYRHARAAHLCPLDYFSHSLMPAALREAGVQTVTLDAARGYMHPDFLGEMPSMVNGLSVFLAKEERLTALFTGHTDDIWEMMAGIASFNCPAVVVHSVLRGHWLLDAASHKRYHIPAYPSRLADITNAGSSFSGGFIAGLLRTQDLLRAVLYGSAIGSLAMEGSGAFYVADSLPGLAESRLQSLEQAVQII